MSDRVQLTIENGIADVRLNRPEKMNALDHAMFAGLIETAAQLADDRSLRAVVLSGEGRCFCAGLDMSSFASMAENAPRSKSEKQPERNLLGRDGSSVATWAQRAALVWTELPVPVIAAIHGVTYGGGLQIALGADIRFATADSRFSVMEIKWGLIPDMTGTQTLRHLVRLDIAKELTFTGRVVSGTEAGEIGLVTHVTETPREDALELAREIASKSPSAIRAGKRLLQESRTIDPSPGLELEAALQTSLIGGAHQKESVLSNLEKRPANFEDPE